MLALLEGNPDVAKGFTKRAGNSTNFWNDLSVKLNCLEPPMCDASGWKKVNSKIKTKQNHILFKK